MPVGRFGERFGWSIRFAAFALFAALAPASAGAQERPVEIAVVHAQGDYDLSGVGWTHLYSVRVPVTFGRWLVVEPGLTYFDYRTQGEEDVSYLMPEVQAQFTPLARRFSPYLGAGIGIARGWSDDASVTDLVLSGSAGARYGLTDDWSVLGELRLWMIDPWTGGVSGFGLGVARRF